MKTVRTRVKSALKRNSKGAPVSSVPLKLPAASASAPSIVSVHEKTATGGTSAPPVSPATPSEKDFPLPFQLGPRSESPVAEKQPEDLDLAGLTFTGDEPEQVYVPPQSIPIMDDSRRSTPRKRVKIQTTLPPSKDNNVEEIKFVSPVDPNYLLDEASTSEPLLDQPVPTDRAFVEFTPKEIESNLPPLHEVLAHQAHLKRLDSSLQIARVASVHDTPNEEKPLLEPSFLSAEVDDILDSVWPLASPSFPSLGWTEHVLPSSAYYYSHAATRTVTDIDLRDEKKLAAVRSYLGSMNSSPVNEQDGPFNNPFRALRGDSTPRPEDGVDLWLRDASPRVSTKNSTDWEFMPMRIWVLHATRGVTFDPPTERDGFRLADDISDEDRLDLENRYWQYMSTHPAHAALPQTAYEEAVEIVTWCYTDRVLRNPQPSAASPPFTQRECVELLELLRNVASPHASSSSSAARTRIVAQILLRYTEWRQKYIVKLNEKQGTTLSKGDVETVQLAIPFRKTFMHFVKGIMCLGIPYLFESRGPTGGTWSSTRNADEEDQGKERNPSADDPALGSSQILVAALLLSASVTFLALPDLNGTSRVAALISTLCSSASMISYVITLHARSYSHGSQTKRPRNAFLTALPLVMLAYSLCAFIIGVIAYSIAGTVASNRPGGFGRYTGWIVVAVSIALALILASSAVMMKKGL